MICPRPGPARRRDPEEVPRSNAGTCGTSLPVSEASGPARRTRSCVMQLLPPCVACRLDALFMHAPNRPAGSSGTGLGVSWHPAEGRAELGGDVGEDLHVVVVLEAERQRERDLVDLAEGGVGVELLGDLRARCRRGRGRTSSGPGPAASRCAAVRLCAYASYFARCSGDGGVGRDDDESLRDAGRGRRRDGGRGTSGCARAGSRRSPSDSSAFTTLLVRKFIPCSPAHWAERRLAPPYHIRLGQARRVRLDPVGEHLEALDAAEVGGRLAADEVAAAAARGS